MLSAMEIGLLIRHTRSTISVESDSLCASSCVLIAAAGVERRIFGPIIIHRPYFGDIFPTPSFTEAQGGYEKLGETVKSYLHRMNVSESLWDEMVPIPPTEGKRLSKDDLKRFLFLWTDPVEEEMERQETAKFLGITPEELVRRQVFAKQYCNSHSDGNYQHTLACLRDNVLYIPVDKVRPYKPDFSDVQSGSTNIAPEGH